MRDLEVRVTIEDPDDPRIGETYLMIHYRMEERELPDTAKAIERFLKRSIWEIDLMDELRRQGRLLDQPAPGITSSS